MNGTRNKKYFSERAGRGPRAAPLSFEDLRKIVVNVLDAFRGRHYFQDAFGYVCVDAGEIPGTIGTYGELGGQCWR
ncbi:MAG: hypothetical protein HY827_04450 [Actinobacteria bacterium]|nr:hypothetical protein [Actinomycetota bacterium]